MRWTTWLVSISVVCVGCTSKVGGNGSNLDVPVYPKAKIIMSGENQGIMGTNFETTDPREKVIAYYEEQLGTKQASGAIKASKAGHQITVIITDAGGGRTAGVITETK